MDKKASDTNTQLDQIAERAQKAAAEYDASQAAIAAERDAEAAVLERAIALTKPALRAVTSKLLQYYASTGGQNGCNPQKVRDYFDSPGLILVNKYYNDSDETGNRGTFCGDRLVLMLDGSLSVATREGTWSHWQGEWSSFQATLTPLTAREAVERYKLDDILRSLRDAFGE